MKRVLLSAALLVAASGTVMAMTSQPQLSTADLRAARMLVPGADLSQLTAAQAGAIAAILHGDDRGQAGEIRAILF